MSDRLSRKEIKRQDTFQVAMGRGLELVQTYRRQIVLLAVALVVAVLAAIGWFVYLGAVEDDAQVALAEAMKARSAPIVEAADAPSGATPEQLSFPTAEARQARSKELFERVVEEYGASAAADVARVYLGEMAATAGDSDRAIELWSDFVDEHPDSVLAAEVRLNLYAIERAAGRGEKVVTELQAMLQDDDPALPQDVAVYELAVTLEALGREEEASQQYQRLVDEFAQSPYAMAARQKTGATAGGFPGLPS
jgi:TolA-binding protein